MPLIRFEVKNEYGLGDPELYRGASKKENPKVLLDGVAVSGLVGILRQLGDLAEFAADVFRDLHEQVMATAARGHKLSTRIHHIEAALPAIEKDFQGQTSHIHFAYIEGSDWHANVRTEQSHLLCSDLPRFIMDSYEECRDPPRLHLLDKFDSSGVGACLKRYSDPSYFKRVWFSSEPVKAEKVQREKKARLNKKKGSRLRKREVQHSVSISRHNSSTQFASPSTDEQSFSAESTSIPDMRLKREVASGSNSFDSKIRLSYVEQVSDTNPSTVPDEVEYDKLSSSMLKISSSDASASAIHDEPNEGGADDDSQHNSLQGQGDPRSPSVTWDEKTEIVKSTSPQLCDEILVDRVQDSDSPIVSSEPSNLDHETAKLGAVAQEDIVYSIANVQESFFGRNQFDEVTSETENYMDALNTLESETETDSDCQTKREVKPLSDFSFQGMEFETGEIQEMAAPTAPTSDSSDLESPNSCHSSLNKDTSPKISNLVSSESLEHVHSHPPAGFAPDPGSSGDNGFCERRGDLFPGTSISNLQNMLGDGTTLNASLSQDSPPPAVLHVPSSRLWTNAGLFGVEPSKPPDFSLPNIIGKDIIPGTKNTECDLSSHTETNKLHCGGLAAKSDTVVQPDESILWNSCSMEKNDGSPNVLSSVDQSSLSSSQLFGRKYNVVQAIDPFKYSPSCHGNQHDGVSVKHNSHESLQLDELQDSPSTNTYAYTDGPGPEVNTVASGAELPVTSSFESLSNESGQNTMGISSTFSNLAHRFLANGLRMEASVTNDDLSTPSEMVNADLRRLQETSFPNEHKEDRTGVESNKFHEPNTKRKIEFGSSRKSISSSSHFSEQSSPPLEHMKISFHPMNGLETSKLKLEFPSDNLHESIEDLIFPSFQLLPGPTVPLRDSGSESDDDTFCRSCPYSSDDLLSPRSDSNSELWEQDERNGSKNTEMSDDSRRISSSTASVSSCIRFEQLNQCGIYPDSEFGISKGESDIVSFQSGPILDLPGFDSVQPSSSQQGRCDSLSNYPEDSALQSPDELPPPPPLPPMQWRIMKPSLASVEEKTSNVAAIVNHLDGLQVQRSTYHQQNEQNVPRPPPIAATMVHPYKRTNDQPKLNGQSKQNHDVNSKDLDEKDDLLQQIRNKSFSLKRTVTTRPSLMPGPTTNVKVTAILEKANAIRQAFVGSDEEDGDNWSDG